MTTAKMVLRPYFMSVSWETGIEETGGAWRPVINKKGNYKNNTNTY